MSSAAIQPRRSQPRRGGPLSVVLAVIPVLLAGRLLLDPLLATPDVGKEARGAFRKALSENNPERLKTTLGALVGLGGKQNIELVLRAIVRVPDSEDTLYWSLIEGACSFTDRPALQRLSGAVMASAKTGLSRDLLYGLSASRSSNVLIVLGKVLREGATDLRLLAVKKVATVFAPESVDLLLEVLETEEQYLDQPHNAALLWEVLGALEGLTGEKFGANSVNWKGWWRKHRDTVKLRRRGDDDDGEGDEQDDERRHTGTVVDSLDRQRSKEFFGLEKAPRKGVVVLSAKFGKPANRDLNNDHIEQVLESMGVPHVVVKREDFMNYDMREAGALVINCAQFHKFCICPTCIPSGDKKNRLRRCSECEKHIRFSAKLGTPALKKIRKFVRQGGYLFGEDWIVKEVLERVWPKVVSTGKVLRTKNGTSVDVVPARGRVSHPYLKGIFRQPGDDDGIGGNKKRDGGDDASGLVQIKHRWSVDDESWVFKIEDRAKSVILMSSGKLQKRAEGDGVVAFAFRPGSKPSTIGRRSRIRGKKTPAGVVLQVLSHFGKQDSQRDEHLLQNLLLNFLIDANVARTDREALRPKPRKKKKP